MQIRTSKAIKLFARVKHIYFHNCGQITIILYFATVGLPYNTHKSSKKRKTGLENVL